MYFSESSEEWNFIHNEDLWVYNKLFLSRVLEYNCGPAGVSVPRPGFLYCKATYECLGYGSFFSY